MSSITLTLSGKTSLLHAQYFPPIDLNDGDYVCGLIDFQTFNTIPNVDESNNMFYYGSENQHPTVPAQNPLETNEIPGIYDRSSSNNNNTASEKTKNKASAVKRMQPLNHIKIPTGSYEVIDLEQVIKKKLSYRNVEFALSTNNNTLKCEILCSQPINFAKPNSIGPLLGFRDKEILAENRTHISAHPADILKVNVIRIECNITKAAYLNDKPAHTIHEFSPNVAPGYKIIEIPQNVIYFPVTVKSVHDLNLSIVDQNNNFMNFRGETITARLHIKKV